MLNFPSSQFETLLKKYLDPYLQQDLLTAKAIKKCEFNDKLISLYIELNYPAAGIRQTLVDQLKAYLQPAVSDNQALEIEVSWKIQAHAIQTGLPGISNVKNIIAIASGKGGVGKSTTAVNLALALIAEGARVGILDADIYGPSQPQMLGIQATPTLQENKTLKPLVKHGVQSMSIGYLIDANTPMIWRGPMVSTALQQLLRDTAWEDVDYLIVDLPPGTGDIQLTLSQKIPVTGAVIVTTPQDIALLDARKALAMFQKVKIPVLGVIENMSVHICKQCGYQEYIFGEGGAKKMAEQYNATLLGNLPLDIRIREEADSGMPTVVKEPNSEITKIYREIARKIAAKLALQAKDYRSKFPKIVIENN